MKRHLPKSLIQFLLSDDGTRVVGEIKGGVLDPAFPTAATVDNFYEIGAGGDPQLASILPNGSPPACGLVSSTGRDTPYLGASGPNHPLSADGSRLYFQTRGDDCGSEPQLYVRDLSLGQTTKISGSPVSGPPCGAGLIKSLPGEVFLWTQARLDPADTEPAACSGASATDGDIYRYDLSDQSLQCVTCVARADADVQIAWPDPSVKTAISEDGSRVYFSTTARLTPEAPPSGTIRVYRVRVATGELAYVGPITADIGTTAAAAALTPDGTQLYFASNDLALQPLGGAVNGATQQTYRYDDTDRSLLCVSCPSDGSAPLGVVDFGSPLASSNRRPLAADGTYAFATPTPLVSADQNTPPASQDPKPGTDVYEWRDGRLILVTDGLVSWPGVTPTPLAMGPSGRDLLFWVTAKYTPDAVDDFLRIYDARIGGGIDFPKEVPPCPLEVCQGTPKGAPDAPAPTSSSYSGRGNVSQPPAKGKRCRKGQRKVRRAGKVRCVAKHRKHKHKQAKHHEHKRRAHR